MATANESRERIFTAAAELTDPIRRAAFLDAACAGDAVLRAEVEELLRHDAEAGSFLAGGLAPERTVDDPSVSERPGAQIGPYKLMEQIGEGGFGLVFVAEQQEPVRRKVALKVIKPGMDTREVLARFTAERQALALMDHPNIARVFDGGATEAGRPYFVMELVRGVPITDYCDENQLPPRERLELFVSVCHAVQHAHQKGIIHRDIKPSNVLVTSHDGRPVVKVIDFGVAKALGQKLTERTVYTQLAQLVGTPLYMSPEQAEMSGLDIDTRSDIYSLGVLLYELLTGTTPFDRERLAKAGLDEIRRVIREEEPEKPSTRLSHSGERLPSVAAQRKTEPARLSRLVRGDLDWITMKCLEKDRARRYETANGLAMDVQRYLADEPVLAGPPSAAYRVKKFVRRNKGPVLAAAAMVGLLVAGTAGTTWGMIRAESARRAEERRAEAEGRERARAEAAERVAKENEARAQRERERADAEKRIAQAVREFLQDDLLRQADPWALADSVRDRAGPETGSNPTIRELLDLAAVALAPDRIESKFPSQPLVQAEVLHTVGQSYRRAGEHAKAITHLERCRDVRSARLGPEHHDTLMVVNSLALAYLDAGRPAESLAVLERNRDVTLRVLGPDHVDTLHSLTNLAMLYRETGRTAEAIRLYEQVRAARTRILGPEHTDTLITTANLANAYMSADRLADGVRLLEQVRDVRVRTSGRDNPHTLTVITNLAAAYVDAGRVAEAVPLYEEAVAGKEKRLGPDHPETLTTLNNLATAYRNARRVPEAIAMLERVRDAREKKLGPDHPAVLVTQNNLCLAYRDANRLVDAVPIWDAIVPKAQKRLGPVHPNTVSMTRNRVMALEATRQYDRGAEAAREWLDGYRRHYPAGDVRLADPLEMIGRCLLKAGRPADAEPVLRECLAVRESAEPNKWSTFHTKSLLGQALLDRKDYAGAEPLLLQGYEGMKQREAKMPAKVRLNDGLKRLVDLYEAWGKPDEAAKWRAKLATP